MKVGIESLIEIGSRVLVSCPDREDPEEAYVSRLEDMRADALAVAVPLWRGNRLLLHDGERVLLRVAMEDAHLEFVSRVRGRAESGVPLFLIAYPRSWRRVQRRENVRLRVMLRVDGFLETPDGSEELCFYTFDISAGGLGLRSPRRLPVGARVTLAFRIQQRRAARRIEARGKVVRVADPERGEYRIGLQFTEIKKSDQDFIVGFIFERMAEQRRLV